MTSVNFQQWIQHPETLDRDTLYELRNMLARYPYFQSLRLLYLKNLYILHDINFGAELRKAVLYIADRRKLFQLIEGDRFAVQSRKKGVPLTEVLKNEPSVDRTLALIDAFLSTVPEEVAGQTTFDYSMDYTTYLLEDNTTAAESEEVAPKLKGYELIDDFIEKSESEAPLCLKPLKEEAEISVTPSEEVSAAEEEDDSCFTETLAKIYVKQQRYSKALEITKNVLIIRYLNGYCSPVDVLYRADSELKRRRTCFRILFIQRYYGRTQNYRFSGKSNLGLSYLHGYHEYCYRLCRSSFFCC